jgi:hypothetical protein
MRCAKQGYKYCPRDTVFRQNRKSGDNSKVCVPEQSNTTGINDYCDESYQSYNVHRQLGNRKESGDCVMNGLGGECKEPNPSRENDSPLMVSLPKPRVVASGLSPRALPSARAPLVAMYNSDDDQPTPLMVSLPRRLSNGLSPSALPRGNAPLVAMYNSNDVADEKDEMFYTPTLHMHMKKANEDEDDVFYTPTLQINRPPMLSQVHAVRRLSKSVSPPPVRRVDAAEVAVRQNVGNSRIAALLERAKLLEAINDDDDDVVDLEVEPRQRRKFSLLPRVNPLRRAEVVAVASPTSRSRAGLVSPKSALVAVANASSSSPIANDSPFVVELLRRRNQLNRTPPPVARVVEASTLAQLIKNRRDAFSDSDSDEEKWGRRRRSRRNKRKASKKDKKRSTKK